MSTSTLVLNYIGWAVLSIVVAVPSILIPLRLDRPSSTITQARSGAVPRGQASARTPSVTAHSSADVPGRSSSGLARRPRPQTAPH